MLNEFKDKIVEIFDLKPIKDSIWEADRDKFIGNINKVYEQYKINNQKCKIEIERVKGRGKDEIEITTRFINNGDRDEECQDIVFHLEDEDNRKVIINAPDDFFEDKIIYPGENRREVVVLKSDDSKFNHKRIKNYSVDFRWV